MSTDQTPINNSAGRLVGLLKETILIGQKNPGIAYISTVCQALSLTPNSLNQAESLSKLFSLIYQIEKDLYLLTPTKIKNHKQTIADLKNIIADQYKNQYGVISQLNDVNSPIIRDLENCADSLSELVDLNLIEEEDLTKFMDDISSLHQTINASNMNEDLKFLLLKKLDSIRDVIVNYRFEGSDGIRKEVENLVGSIIISREKVSKESDKALIVKIFDLICKLLSAASATKNLLSQDATNFIKNLLPHQQ